MSDCTERSEGQERMQRQPRMSDCTERSEGQERMQRQPRMSDCTERSEGQERRRGFTVLSLVVALLAGGTLMSGGTQRKPPPPPGRVAAQRAWPGAQRGTMPAGLADGPLFQPLLFLDANTALGTAPSPDATSVRLLLRRADGSVRLLRRVPYDDEVTFDNATAAGDGIVWTESASGQPCELWTANLRTGGPVRRLVADAGNLIAFGTQEDLVVAGGRVHWAADPGDSHTTEIRSVALSGGAVRVRAEDGAWALSRWPWLTSGAETTVLRSMGTGREVVVRASGSELVTCSPVWCRAMVMNETGLARIDLMHPDGSARRTVAGGGAQAPLNDVAVLDRLEVLSEPGPDSDLTGTAKLLVYDISTRRTVVVSPSAAGVSFRNGVLWWSTGDQETTTWYSLDLRTV
ncbi:hypothetical protein [Mangrovihabitans endophyticus]|uniref:Uncharacterized protein n=1 Tax=Mangrovihabitans endophyticus TaxID=1751298 RepID=A0A8J3BWA5_9ACTN|nr:hypothetical protein [Mangrovihabitans endophyticus]GGK76089.1 hypothetical protein GCM10012284_07630 [Mangrovihabitans endophyticus]